jgi:hypothetical protein
MKITDKRVDGVSIKFWERIKVLHTYLVLLSEYSIEI